VSLRTYVRGMRLSTRLGLAMAGILVVAALAEATVYLRTRNETLEEANASYQALAKAIEVAQTQMGERGWKDERVLGDYLKALEARGLRDIRVTDEKGLPFPAPSPENSGKRRRPGTPKEIFISGVVGEGPTNRSLEIPVVVDGKLQGYIELRYTLENIRDQLADNFRRRLFALLGVFALGIAFILVIVRNATQPVERLAEGASRVAEGRFDVTVPVNREDEIGQLAAAFNNMTGRLRERQLLEARLAAAEKRAEIGQLASGLAHEIKNPLNALSLGLDVLRRRHRPANDEAGDYTARIEALRGEINRLAALINSFLTFGRPLQVTLRSSDLGAIVKSTISDLAETAERAGVAVTSDVPPALPPVDIDPSLVKSALWNLLQNAVQAMEQTGGALHVAVTREAPAGKGGPPRLVVTVEDTGPGFEPEDLPRLFEPYYSRKEGGVGLGLAMVKRIVEEHGGRVTAENRTGGPSGASFRLFFPVATAA
jgi:signal transduction histidine kinase